MMDEFMPQALPVCVKKSKGDDPNKPATTAEEYLSRVRHEAKQCPDVVVAELEVSRRRPQSVLPTTEEQVESTLPWSTPSREWQTRQSEEFTQLRERLAQLLENRAKDLEERCPAMPTMKDELGWCRFCLGAEFQGRLLEAIGAAGEEPPAEVMEAEEGGASLPEDCAPRPPLLSILLNMDQPMIQRVLDYHIHWLQLTGFTIAQGCWLYGLMSCVAAPLFPDSAASLRVMARACRNIRLSLESEEDERLPSLNLLIALVANYFHQGDLMDKG